MFQSNETFQHVRTTCGAIPTTRRCRWPVVGQNQLAKESPQRDGWWIDFCLGHFHKFRKQSKATHSTCGWFFFFLFFFLPLVLFASFEEFRRPAERRALFFVLYHLVIFLFLRRGSYPTSNWVPTRTQVDPSRSWEEARATLNEIRPISVDLLQFDLTADWFIVAY